jgi:hypothetical protein
LLERQSSRTVCIARLLPLTRTFISLPAAARHVPLVRFITLSTIGCALLGDRIHAGRDDRRQRPATVSSILGRVLLAVGILMLAHHGAKAPISLSASGVLLRLGFVTAGM